MFARRLILFLLIAFSVFSATAQKIIYSEADKDDNRRLDFEVVGKIQGNFLIHKNCSSTNRQQNDDRQCRL